MKKESKTKSLRRLDIHARRLTIAAAHSLSDAELIHTGSCDETLTLADKMVENAVGYTSIPLGIAAGFLIDGSSVSVPLALEEPSVVAAASYAASIIASAGGFATWAEDPVMTAQIHLETVPPDAESELASRKIEIEAFFESSLVNMAERGGGFRGVSWGVNRESGTMRVDIDVDVRDAMGANILNTSVEAAAPLIAEITGGKVLMAIVSNAARRRRAGAKFSIPVAALDRLRTGGIGADECARRIILANRIAETDPDRAVTHNKGIMNGISSLALATGNDTRAIESAAHFWAGRDGRYAALTTYEVLDGDLHGSIELPLPFASVGGAIPYHPAYSLALKVLGNPDGRRLSRIAAALGLAQNFAALLALVTTGIQKGHMRLHSRRSTGD